MPRLSKELCIEAVRAFEQCGRNVQKAAEFLGIPRSTMNDRLNSAKMEGLSGDSVPVDEVAKLKDKVRTLEQTLRRTQTDLSDAAQKTLGEEEIRRKIIGLKQSVESAETPEWVTKPAEKESAPGVPTLFLSDFHWGEVVHPSQINNVNKYNLAIAQRRLSETLESSVTLLRIISPKMDYPGIVIPLGGDMVSGNIHDELSTSNELNTMPTVLDLFGHLVKLIAMAADQFGRVFLPCVTGNHGRDTHKIWAKDRHHTSFDWLLYCFLAKHFEEDKRITFLIPDGPDAYYKIFGHRYLLTHGDQFRGGDGLIGALGPIIRGDHRKRSRNSQINMEYDTLLLGHWHQYMHLTRLIVNGSLKGMDEYAYSNNFPFEQPQQALWLTHPRHGITFRMPVYVNRGAKQAQQPWVSWQKVA